MHLTAAHHASHATGPVLYLAAAFILIFVICVACFGSPRIK